MKKVLSIAAVALFIAGSSAFACGGEKYSQKESAEQTACSGEKSSQQESAEKMACSGSKKSDKATSEQAA